MNQTTNPTEPQIDLPVAQDSENNKPMLSRLWLAGIALQAIAAGGPLAVAGAHLILREPKTSYVDEIDYVFGGGALLAALTIGAWYRATVNVSKRSPGKAVAMGALLPIALGRYAFSPVGSHQSLQAYLIAVALLVWIAISVGAVRSAKP